MLRPFFRLLAEGAAALRGSSIMTRAVEKEIGVSGSRHISKGALAWVGLNVGMSFFSSAGAPPDERRKRLVSDLALTFLPLGFRGTGTMFLANLGVSASIMSGALGRGVVQTVRSGLEVRSMAAIPFSHSTVNIQQAYQSLQYAKSRLGDGYSTLGGEAGFMSAKYLAR